MPRLISPIRERQLQKQIDRDYRDSKIDSIKQRAQNIEWEGQKAKVVVNKDGSVELIKPEGMPDALWEYYKVGALPEDTTFTITETVDGKEITKDISKTEMMDILRKRHDAYLVGEAYEQFEKEKPLQYWIHTAGWAIMQPWSAVSQAVGEIRGELKSEDRYQLQAERLQDFKVAVDKGALEFLNPITGYSSEYIRTFVLAPTTGFAGGRVLSRVVGYGMGRAPVLTSVISRIVASASTGVLGGVAYNMYQDYESEKDPVVKRQKLASLVEFVVTTYTAYKGIKSGVTAGASKRLTPYEQYYEKGYSARMKALAKKGVITPEKAELMSGYAKTGLKLEKGFRTFDPRKYQVELTKEGIVSKVETLKGKPGAQKFFKTRIKSSKAEVFGGATYKPKTHDLDIMYKRYWREQPLDRYAMEKMGYRLEDIADIKIAQKPGEIVSTAGTVKMKPLKIRGVRQMRITEQAGRLRSSSLELAHTGRTKDIMKSAELYRDMWIQKGAPAEMFPDVYKYWKTSKFVAKDPYMMTKWKSDIVYGPNWRELIQKTGAEIYYRTRKPTLAKRFKTTIRGSPKISTSVSIPVSKSFKSSISKSKSSSIVSKSSSMVSSTSSTYPSKVSVAPRVIVSPFFGFLPQKRRKQKPKLGYHVYIEDNGKLVRITKQPLATRNQALGMGGEIVDNTISKRFKVQQTSTPAVGKPGYAVKWKQIQHKFDPNLVERKKFRRDTYGEKMKRSLFKPKVVKL